MLQPVRDMVIFAESDQVDLMVIRCTDNHSFRLIKQKYGEAINVDPRNIDFNYEGRLLPDRETPYFIGMPQYVIIQAIIH